MFATKVHVGAVGDEAGYCYSCGGTDHVGIRAVTVTETGSSGFWVESKVNV